MDNYALGQWSANRSIAPPPLPGESVTDQVTRLSGCVTIAPEPPEELGRPCTEAEAVFDDVVCARGGHAALQTVRRDRALRRREELRRAGAYTRPFLPHERCANAQQDVTRAHGARRSPRTRERRSRQQCATRASRAGPNGRDEGDGEPPPPPPATTQSAQAELSNRQGRDQKRLSRRRA